MWANGDHAVVRWRPEVVAPVTVIEYSPALTAFYLAAGTPIKQPVALDGSQIPREMPYEQRYAFPKRAGDGLWHTNSVLMLTRPGAAHSFWAFWRASDWSFLNWYVNLQAPLEQTPLGFNTEDHVLDIVVARDLSWKWKDEEEFAAAQRVGRFTAEEAAAIRAEGENAISAIESREWPFDAGWEDWRPDPSWPIPDISGLGLNLDIP